MRKFLLPALLAFTCLLVPCYAYQATMDQQPAPNIPISAESDNGFTEDTIQPYAQMSENGEPMPAEPPAFKGVKKHNTTRINDKIYAVRMNYPSFGKPELDKMIADWVTMYCDDFIATACKDYNEERESYIKWEMAGTYSVTQASPSVISVLFRIFVYSGGAHGSIHHIVKTFDTNSNQEIPNSEFFTDQKRVLAILSEHCRSELAKREDSEGLDSIFQGTEATPGNFNIIVPRPQGLLAIFYSGQLGSMASGIRIVFVPLEKFRAYIEPGKIWQ